MTIKRVADADIPAVIALAGVIWRQHYPGIISHEQIEYMLGRMYAPEVIRSEIAAGVRWVKVVLEDAMVGFAAYGPADMPGTLKLHKLYLLQSMRGKGFGGALIRHVADEAKSMCMSRIMLTVNKGNAGAIAAYTKNGFVVDHEAVFDIGGGFVMDDYVMVKEVR